MTPQSGNRVSTSVGNSGICWTVFARNRDTAVHTEGNGDLQTLICVLVARPRRCLTMSNPVPWRNWMATYLGYSLRAKTLFCGWPVTVDDITHTRRRRPDSASCPTGNSRPTGQPHRKPVGHRSCILGAQRQVLTADWLIDWRASCTLQKFGITHAPSSDGVYSAKASNYEWRLASVWSAEQLVTSPSIASAISVRMIAGRTAYIPLNNRETHWCLPRSHKPDRLVKVTWIQGRI